MSSHIQIIFGDQASKVLNDAEFIKKWLTLYNQCLYATVFQSPEFVCSWYEMYSSEWTPVVISSWDTDNELTALWTLAFSSKTNSLVHAGTFQAEYHTWLALPDKSERFLAAAWSELKKQFKFSTLRFTYLPPSLIHVLQSIPEITYNLIVRKKNRPLINLNINELKNSFAKRKNKSKLNHLKKLGELKFSRITELAELERVLPELISYYDFRQGALHHATPFQDDDKKHSFLTRLFILAPDKICITVTYLNNTPIAAMIGMVSKKVVHLGLLPNSPFLAQYSPGKLHLMQLREYLISQDYECFDLTPGDDLWKERFANAHDEATEVILYKFAYFRFLVMLLNGLKKFFKPYKSSLNRVKTLVYRLSRIRISKLIYRIKNWIKEDREMLIYCFECSFAKNFASDERVKCNSLSDLLSYQFSERWQNKYDFLSAALQRLEAKEYVYTVTIDSCLAIYIWMMKDRQVDYIFQYPVNIPEKSIVFFDAYTHPKFRKKGLYEATLAHMIHDAFTFPDIEHIYIYVSDNNLLSSHIIEKIGFQYWNSVFMKRRFGFIKKWIDKSL